MNTIGTDPLISMLFFMGEGGVHVMQPFGTFYVGGGRGDPCYAKLVAHFMRGGGGGCICYVVRYLPY